jgi:hypothetical protein
MLLLYASTTAPALSVGLFCVSAYLLWKQIRSE